jgi:hypothetical protein
MSGLPPSSVTAWVQLSPADVGWMAPSATARGDATRRSNAATAVAVKGNRRGLGVGVVMPASYPGGRFA